MRTVRVGRRARALAVSWPPYDGKRCTTAPDGRYRLRVIARDVPGNTRAVDLGAITARGVVLSPPDRSIVAGRRARIGISADARGLRLELARLGDGAPQVLARGTRAPAAIARVPATARGGVYVVSNRHAGRTSEALLAVRGASPARVALLSSTGSRRPSLLPFQRRLDALGHPLRRDHRAGTCARACSTATRPSSCPRSAEARTTLGHPARDERRRHQARARHVIPRCDRARGRRGLRRAAHGHGPDGAARRARPARRGNARPARLARRRRHVARARRAGRGRARRRARARHRSPRAPCSAGPSSWRSPSASPCRSGSRCTSAARTRTCSCRSTR